MAQSATTSARATPNPANVNIIGLYGIPGSGKSTFIKQLGVLLNTDNLDLREGSEVIERITLWGLEAFAALTSAQKTMYLEQGITKVRDECVQSGKTVVVAGNLMFWNDAQQTAPDPVCTRQDLEMWTDTFYFETDPNIVAQRRHDDRGRARPKLSVGHLRRWQEEEKRRLQQLCYENSIIFSCIVDTSVPYKMPINRIRPLTVLQDCWKSCEKLNKTIAAQKLDNFVAQNHSLVETMLVFDADKTLAPVDTSDIFFMGEKDEPLKTLFRTAGYTYTAFRQATLLYEEAMTDTAFEATCEQITTKISICDEILNLLQAVDQHNHVGMVVMTCGLRLLGDKALARAGLSTAIPAIGGRPITDGYVVTPETKARLVARLEDHHGLRVVAFEDSEMDLPMLKRADQAVIVVGDEVTRTSFTKRHLSIFNATESTAAKLLQTAMRDAKISDPALHVIGLEECPINHVEGTQTLGHRLVDEQRTTIVPLMRGGEPMAFGVSEAFPPAMFVHALKMEDLGAGHLRDQSTVILVDAVINTGQSIVEFVERVRKLKLSIRIIVVAGVVQADTVKSGGTIRKLAWEGNLSVVALRVSENSYKATRLQTRAIAC
ncbi:hypothetical protein LTR56_024815 [Elasticomyces elasticus]|nr:hypothetical protein LTR56_024815 [Elasticomyces elasticus]KAK3621796.1 hypothetical protein LTR22_025059 [Elasticomyces elasticus]KAK4906631.1 hypothetical protein LTR49_024244 [Elasticomyces elasticus]